MKNKAQNLEQTCPELRLVEIEKDINKRAERINELFDKLIKSYSDINDKCQQILDTYQKEENK